jgi:AcrR family transcriptional regulator
MESEARRYHHGRLREALVDAGVELARVEGPDAVVLRAVSRVAGVSHNAAYRHFADRDELLRAVCERCMSELARLMEQRMAQLAPTDPVSAAWARLTALGQAYVEFATTEPGWFRTAFAVPRGTEMFGPEEGVAPCGLGPFGLLNACLDDLVAVGAVAEQRRAGLEYAAWASVHGLASLLNDGPLRDLADADRIAARDVLLDVVARGMQGT